MIVACSLTALVLLVILPETYPPKILHHHEKQRFMSKQPADEERGPAPSGIRNSLGAVELEQSGDSMRIRDCLLSAIIKPIQISFQDPAIAYVNIYTSYLYSCYYTFFDGFPMVYAVTYRFPLSRIGLVFLPIIVGCAIAMLVYCIYIIRNVPGKEAVDPEARLRPALLAVFAVPIGIFVFGWTTEATSNAHWIWGMLGLVIYSGGVFVVLQCIIMYILDSYPRYAASLFAANDFSRSALAAGAVHFGQLLYKNLGSGKACTILGSISILGIGGMFMLFWKGRELRRSSKFAEQVATF